VSEGTTPEQLVFVRGNDHLEHLLSDPLIASGSPVSTGDLARFGDAFVDLADSGVMSRAWRRPTG
jgi:hypothetical protein